MLKWTFLSLKGQLGAFEVQRIFQSHSNPFNESPNFEKRMEVIRVNLIWNCIIQSKQSHESATR